jgi:hypothetical protein
VLVSLLLREAKMRRSQEIQEAMERAEESVDTEWMDVIDTLQRRIVLEFHASSGECSSVSTICVSNLRKAAIRYPDIAFWVKYNRAREGMLRAGVVAPDLHLLCAVNGEATTLLARRKKVDETDRSPPKPTVVVAGSLS